MMRVQERPFHPAMIIAASAVMAALPAQSTLPAWRTEREAIVTAGEGGASLAWPVSVAVSLKGVIAATQPADGWIRLFAADGRPIGTIGGLERTPFDAMRLTRIGFRAETLWIADALKNRFTLFGLDMRLTRIIEAPPIPLGEAGLAGAAAAEALLSGRQVLLTSRPAQLGVGAVHRRLAVAQRPVTQDLVDAEAQWLAKTIRPMRADTLVSGYLGKLSMEANLPAVHRIIVGNDGTVWLRLTHRHEAERWMVLGPNGSPRATVSLPIRLDRDVHDVAPDRIWATERTADGLPQIVAYRIVPPV
jgi:hypothetical protein